MCIRDRYKDVARTIEKLHIIFEESGIRKGDKSAVCGRNSSHWGVTFLATLTYGAVIVPILHEFKADNVHKDVYKRQVDHPVLLLQYSEESASLPTMLFPNHRA